MHPILIVKQNLKRNYFPSYIRNKLLCANISLVQLCQKMVQINNFQGSIVGQMSAMHFFFKRPSGLSPAVCWHGVV